MALLLNAKNLNVAFPAKQVLRGVTLGVNEGDRIGIVGKNGDGKSTLLRVLAGIYTPDEGEVTRRGSLTVGVLTQTDELPPELSVEQAVVGDMPVHSWASDRKIRAIIQALIGDIPWTMQAKELSGGQTRRVVLARLLIQDWDILMLDEPTNHLDIKTIAWLAQHLKERWTKNCGALLVVTHDRWFLDEVAEEMWEVQGGGIETFEGGFSAYIQQRVERLRLSNLQEEKRRNHLRKELAWLARGAQARSTKPKFRVKAARELIEDDPPLRNQLALRRASMARLGKQVFVLKGATKSFGESKVLDKLDWLIGPGDRIGIMGANGSGKTTFLRLITGELCPTSGSIKVGQTVQMACLSQRLESLELLAKDRVREVLAQHTSHLVIEGKSVSSSQLLEQLGFEKEHLQSFVADLSGGQKRRLQLLLVLIDEPNVLLLDEPGNDMDIDMLGALEDLLDTWPGTLVLVSHDRHLLERVTDEQYAFIDGAVQHLPGGVDEYLRLLSAQGEAAAALTLPPAAADAAKKASGDSTAESSVGSGSPLLNSQPKGAQVDSYQVRKELRSAERKLTTLERKRLDLQAAMQAADPLDYLALADMQEKLNEILSRMERAEHSWLELAEQLDKA